MAQAHRRAAKLGVVGGMERGLPWHQAAEASDIRLSRATAFRALRIVRTQGDDALEDGRHGHPHKLAGAVRQWLVEYCRGAPGTPSWVVQAEIDAGAQDAPGGSTCSGSDQSCTAQQCCAGFTCLLDQTSGTEKFCCPDTQLCGQTCCPTGGVCVDRTCLCLNSERCFTADDPIGTCRNLQNDNNNCSECGLACDTAAGEACCSGVCRNLLEDEQNCGLCGVSCGANETCIAGVCCPNTRVCGNTCLATACSATACEICDPLQGRCVSTCTASQTCLAGVCCANNLVCGNTCLATACAPLQCQVCDAAQGKCVSTCTGSQVCCNGVCNCGTCGTICTAPDVCCPPGSGNRTGTCKRPTGATCTGNGQCCSNKCQETAGGAPSVCT